MSEPIEYVFKKLDWALNYSNQKFLPGQTVPGNMPVEVIAAWLENGTIEEKHGKSDKPVKAKEEIKADPVGEQSPLEDFTVSELSDLLRAEGLPIRGTKAEKIARLEEAGEELIDE